MRRYPKMAATVIWFAAFLALAFGIFCVLDVNALPMDIVPRSCIERYLYELEVEYARYRADPSPRHTVLIGPSYGRELGNFDGVYNLALGAGSRAECDSIASQCLSSDNVFYILTIRELASAGHNRLRVGTTHHALRKLAILRGIAQMYLGIDDIPKAKPYHYDPHELGVLAESVGKFDRESMLKYSFRRLDSLFSTTDTVSIKPHIKLAKKHPNLVFVIHPMIPMRPVSSETKTGRKINHVIAEREKMLTLYSESGLSFIDLSNMLPAEYFRDLWHLTPDGIKLLRAKIQSVLASA